jgi:hypothetical protein
MASKKAILAFATKILANFQTNKWEEGKEEAWADALVDALSASTFSDDVVDLAARQMVESRMNEKTPLVAECIQACIKAKRIFETERQASALPAVAEKTEEASEDHVWNVLMVNPLAKKAANEGWIGMLVPYCFKHGRLPEDPGVIAEMKREAKAVETWNGSNPIVAKNKIMLLERRQQLADRVRGRR